MALESTITKNILEYLNDLEQCVAEKVAGSSLTGKGRADINGCWNGRSFRIEVKSPDHRNKPSKAQVLNMKRWSRAGSICFSAYSLKDVQRIINKYNKIYIKHFEGEIY